MDNGMSPMISPPNGWTTDPNELYYDKEWAADDSIGQRIAAEYQLGRGHPIMYRPDISLLIFRAGGRYYLLNRDDWGVFEITLSTDLDEIVSTLKDEGNGSSSSGGGDALGPESDSALT